MSRREFPTAVRSAAFDRANGHCERCTTKLVPGKFAYDHIVPDALNGEPILSNCMVLCDNCHGEKTSTKDVPQIAKGKRQRAKHIGAVTAPRVKMRGPGFRKRPPQHTATRPLARKSERTA